MDNPFQAPQADIGRGESGDMLPKFGAWLFFYVYGVCLFCVPVLIGLFLLPGARAFPKFFLLVFMFLVISLPLLILAALLGHHLGRNADQGKLRLITKITLFSAVMGIAGVSWILVLQKLTKLLSLTNRNASDLTIQGFIAVSILFAVIAFVLNMILWLAMWARFKREKANNNLMKIERPPANSSSASSAG
ncbi:MAG: hypothetical protein ABIP02_06680 [Arenimonas sp.]